MTTQVLGNKSKDWFVTAKECYYLLKLPITQGLQACNARQFLADTGGSYTSVDAMTKPIAPYRKPTWD